MQATLRFYTWDSKTRGFPPHPHRWFGFVGERNLFTKSAKSRQEKSKLILMSKTETGSLNANKGGGIEN